MNFKSKLFRNYSMQYSRILFSGFFSSVKSFIVCNNWNLNLTPVNFSKLAFYCCYFWYSKPLLSQNATKVRSILVSHFIHTYETQHYWVRFLEQKTNKLIFKETNSIARLVSFSGFFTSKGPLTSSLKCIKWLTKIEHTLECISEPAVENGQAKDDSAVKWSEKIFMGIEQSMHVREHP